MSDEHCSIKEKYGYLAKSAGAELPLTVFFSQAGFYIGTSQDGMPYSRESIEYWRRKEQAKAALETGCWSQKMWP